MQNPDKQDIKFYESIFILFKCQQAINNLWNKLGNSNQNIKGFVPSDTPLLYHIILEVVSYSDEYDLYFNPKYLDKYKERISQIKEINKPIFKEMRQWKLKEFRNNIIAHPWRNGVKFAHPDSSNYNVPNNPLEFSILVNYVNYSWSLIEREFEFELLNTMTYMVQISNFPSLIKDYSLLNQKQIMLVDEVNKKCLDFKKDYALKVFLFDFSGLGK